jgi:hypothetical protein
MKVKDFQFIKNFLISREDIPSEISNNLLNFDVEIKNGEKDHIVKRTNSVIYETPSSIMKFLYNLSCTLINEYTKDPLERDKNSLILLHLCRDYVYVNFDKNKNHVPPVVCKFNKFPISTLIMNELIEPITGKIDLPLLAFRECNFTDSCRFEPSKNYIIINHNIHNNAAVLAHLIFKTLELHENEEFATKIIRKVLLGKDSDNLQNMITILQYIDGNPIFPFEFINLLQSHAKLTKDEVKDSVKIIESDVKMQKMIKEAYGNYTPQVFHQWSQWAMLMGLVEKQLGHMRGSFWPTTVKMKPHEDKKRKMIIETAKEKGKNQLNMEEMLEVARNWYNHNAVEPGKLFEKVLKEERVWN